MFIINVSQFYFFLYSVFENFQQVEYYRLFSAFADVMR